MRNRHSGFTLVELLVVMAIISILAAMLLPVLGKALEASRTTTCGNTEKQHYIALQLYSDDWDGFYPANGATMAGFYSCGWPHTLIWQKYFESSRADPGASTSSGDWDRFFEVVMQSVFRCPKATPMSYWGRVRTGNYGINTAMLASGQKHFKSITALRPGKLFLVGDNRENTSGAFGIDLPYPTDRMIIRHNKGGNFVYHDGHWQNRQVLLGPSGSTSYGGYYKYLPFYNVRNE